MKKNFFALGLGALLAVSIFYVVNDPSVFQANVLGIQDRDILEKKQWNLWYKLVDNKLEVYVSGKQIYNKIVVTVSYDEKNVKFDLNNIEYQWTLVGKSLDEWSLKLSFDLEFFDSNESLFTLPFVWENNQIVVSEWRWFIDDELVSFDIWNLGSEWVHR